MFSGRKLSRHGVRRIDKTMDRAVEKRGLPKTVECAGKEGVSSGAGTAALTSRLEGHDKCVFSARVVARGVHKGRGQIR